MIDNNLLHKIKDATNIVDVVGEFVSLRRVGSRYVGVCPFHNDTHPSMSVDSNRQTFKCFVCGEGGDVFAFLQKHEQMTFVEAVQWCGKRLGIDVAASDDPSAEAKHKAAEAMYIALQAATDYYRENLKICSSYIEKRGHSISEPVFADFRIGYSLDSNDLIRYMKSAGYSPEVLSSVGLMADGQYGPYDVFRDRIMFPFLDLQGRTIGYSGRYITVKENTGKYVNTGETPLFRKGDNLFGLYQAKKAIQTSGFAYLVEGQFDVLSMHSVGLCNTIAGSGTALTEKQVSLISRFTDSIVLAYDSDAAGIKATLANCKLFLQKGFSVKCVLIKGGKDPDEIALRQQSETGKWFINHTKSFLDYFVEIYDIKDIQDLDEKERKLSSICDLISSIPSETKRLSYSARLAEKVKVSTAVISAKVLGLMKPVVAVSSSPGIYGLDELKDNCRDDEYCLLTADLDNFMQSEIPSLYLQGRLSIDQIQELRKAHQLYQSSDSDLSIDNQGVESTHLQNLVDLYRSGLQVMIIPEADTDSGEQTFLSYYVDLYRIFFENAKPCDKTEYIQRCALLISLAEDSVRIVNFASYYQKLGLNKAQLTEILKPLLAQRKARMVIASQRDDDESYEDQSDQVPDYVDSSEMYSKMWKQCGFFPKLNKDKEPVCYMFHSDKGSFTPVGDFFMTPLLHIQSDDPDLNKRVIKINRRYYRQPLFIEVKSKALLKKSSIEEELILLEAVNFTNGEEKHWTKIREWMSRNFCSCTEIKTYGNQQVDGLSRREDQMFFAFANGIYHQVDGAWRFDAVNEFGVVTHNSKNYYLPAYSNIYAGEEKDSDKYEDISSLTYKEVPAGKQCSFEHWAELMDQVYKINDNGKWAILFAIMCAFRSNIHGIDRLFTAPFFMGPMSGGKTQIAISIRSLFVSPKVPIFNLNIGTDAAMSSKMSAFRDVPIVLDEYNNKDISDIKFQALKGIVYDGDGRQKRKNTSSKEIENDKVFAPVIICGQETPQRDDNALMSRIIVCEVPKPLKARSEQETALFESLKGIEESGLSNVLLQILKLRPLVMDHFRHLKQQSYAELKKEMSVTGEIDRLMKTAALFLATCRLIEEYTQLKLPFTYKQFFDIACNKIRTQLSLITRTDKLAVFFRAMDSLIDNHVLIYGRDFAISQPGTITIKTDKEDEPKTIPTGDTHILFLRIGKVYTKYANNSHGDDVSTQSTIEQNLRSNPAYMGFVKARKFVYHECVETSDEIQNEGVYQVGKVTDIMLKKMERRQEVSTCVAINYDTFMQIYDIDLRRKTEDAPSDQPALPAAPEKLPF